MAPPREFRQMLERALGPNKKKIALQAIGGLEKTAVRELEKILSGERGEKVWAAIEEILNMGDRELIRRWLDMRLAPPEPAELLEAIGKQLNLFSQDVEDLKELLEEQRSNLIPMKRHRNT